MIPTIIGAIAIVLDAFLMFKKYMEKDLVGVIYCGILLIGLLIARS